MKKFKLIDNPKYISFKQWSDFVFKHPLGNAFQTPEMYEVYKKSDLYEPIFVAALNGNEILGILLGLVQREYKYPLGFISARSIVWGGPLALNNDPYFISSLIGAFDKIARRKAIYTQYRNFWDQDKLKLVFENHGYKYYQHLNILVDLTTSYEVLWKNIESRKRSYINKAKKEGFVFEIATTDAQLRECYDILKGTYFKAKLPLPAYSFFKSLHEASNSLFSFVPFIVMYENEITSCMFAICYRDRVYEYYVGVKSTFSKKNSGDLLLWEIFQWSKGAGFSVFDFGGAGKPDEAYGVRDYKKKFGGTLVEHGRYEKIHHPHLFQLAKLGFRLWQKLRF